MELNQKRVKQEQQYCYSVINRRPQQTRFREFQPSMIVPDRNMSMSAIMSKYGGGQHRGLQPQYTPPDMMDMVQGIDARKLSICELHQRIDDNRARIRQMQNTLQLQEQQKRVKEAEQAQIKYREQLKTELEKEMQEIPKMH